MPRTLLRPFSVLLLSSVLSSTVLAASPSSLVEPAQETGSAAPPIDAACVLTGFWKFYQSPAFYLRLRKTDAKGNWNASYYPGDGTDGYWYSGSRERSLQIDTGERVPRLQPFCDQRNDTKPPFALPSEIFQSDGEELQMWGGLQNVQGDDHGWFSPNTSAWDPAEQLCPVAVKVTHLVGQNQLILRSGGCNDVKIERVRLEWVPLDEPGYQEVAGHNWLYGMEVFVRRVVASKGWTINDDGSLQGFIRYYIGPPPNQTFAHMMEELQAAKWVTKPNLGLDEQRILV